MSFFCQSYNEFWGNMYYCTRSSLIGSLKECIEDIKSLGLSSDISFVDLDCHAEVRELEQVDLLGIKSFSMHDSDGTCEVSTFIICSTMNDINGIRLSKIIGYVFSRFLSSRSVKIINEERQIISSLDIRTGTEIMPMSKSDGRMVQYIDIVANISTPTR